MGWQEKFADDEILRLKIRKERMTRIRSGFESLLVMMIECLAQPDRRGVKRESFDPADSEDPESVVISDERDPTVAQGCGSHPTGICAGGAA